MEANPTETVKASTETQQQVASQFQQVKDEKAAKRLQLLTKLFRNKRQKDADQQLEQQTSADESLLTGFRHNKFGAFCLQAGDIVRAEEHLKKGRDIIYTKYPFSNVWMNLGNIEAQKKNYQAAIDCYEQCIQLSPHRDPKSFSEENQVVFSGHLNSFEAYADAHANLAVMYVQLGQPEKAFQYCNKSLQLKPESNESAVNFTDIMRQLGRKEEAIKHSWKQIIDYTRLTKPDYEGFKQIEIVPWNKHEVNTTSPKHISVLTVKWGTRYDAAYVNKLYGGITKHTTWHVDFYCFTDDANGLHPNIIPQQLEDGWKKWWGKATLFSSNIKGRLFYIDLDMIVTGSLDELFSYDGQFATLRTGDLSCQKNHKNGYNSSVMIWQGNLLLPVYGFLKDNFDGINKYIVRFDYWLEMTISNADYLQELFPRMIVDFKETEKRLPEDCRIVCFARKPKPEDYPAEWVRYYWVQ